LAHKKPGPTVRRKDREGACLSRGTAVESNGHKWRPVVRKVYKGENQPCVRARKRSPGMVVIN